MGSIEKYELGLTGVPIERPISANNIVYENKENVDEMIKDHETEISKTDTNIDIVNNKPTMLSEENLEFKTIELTESEPEKKQALQKAITDHIENIMCEIDSVEIQQKPAQEQIELQGREKIITEDVNKIKNVEIEQVSEEKLDNSKEQTELQNQQGTVIVTNDTDIEKNVENAERTITEITEYDVNSSKNIEIEQISEEQLGDNKLTELKIQQDNMIVTHESDVEKNVGNVEKIISENIEDDVNDITNVEQISEETLDDNEETELQVQQHTLVVIGDTDAKNIIENINKSGLAEDNKTNILEENPNLDNETYENITKSIGIHMLETGKNLERQTENIPESSKVIKTVQSQITQIDDKSKNNYSLDELNVIEANIKDFSEKVEDSTTECVDDSAQDLTSTPSEDNYSNECEKIIDENIVDYVEYEYESSDGEEIDEEIRNIERLEDLEEEASLRVNGEDHEQMKDGTTDNDTLAENIISDVSIR